MTEQLFHFQVLKQQQAGMPTGNPLYMQQPPPSHVHYAQQQQQQQQQQHDNATEQQQQQQQQSQHLWPPNANPPAPSPGLSPGVPGAAAAANGTALTINLNNQLDAIKMQQNTLREQIKQSDANLSAQHTVNKSSLFCSFFRCCLLSIKHAYIYILF